ncbi:E2/UBC family protein [uncultured Christiangramia sp.]|uniref:E2/UBC family protein n=1 Tax=Christiangramia sp. 3-2217-3z TaxID=3417564 RepID=UPI0026096F4C|nr:E2/UBC family protein [uncultured Christiangramia sp.]
MFLPEFDREYLISKGYQFEEIVEGNRNGLIIKNYMLPSGKYNHERSDLLILIPQGYPDARPDMWYFNPPILLKPSNRPARQTQATITFEGKTWQRWSRHYPANEWRSGIDGIHTYLKKVKTALSVAR